MKIRTVLLLSAIALILSTGIIGSVVLFATRQAESIASQGTQAETLIQEVFKLNALAQEYIGHPEDRPKSQWYLQYDSVNAFLASPVLNQSPSREFLPPLRTGVQDVKLSFDALVAQTEAAAPNPAVQTQIAADVVVKIQRMVLDAGNLAKRAYLERASARAKNDRLVFILLGILALAANVILLIIYRRVVHPILRLQKGAEVVGSGKLDYRVGVDQNDEIGRLSRSFDAMSATLKASYDTLEEKVKARTNELSVMSRRNQVLLRSIGDGVIAIDRFWNITLWNPATAAMTGWREEEAVGKPFRERVHFIREHDRKENLTFIEEAMLYGEVKQMANSTLLLTRDGREVPVSDSAAPIFDEAGVVIGVIIVFRDATREKESSLLRTDFAYASHQLRTPVNKALWNLEMLLEEPGVAPFKDALNVAYRGVLDVQKLAERLLMVSEIDQKRMVPQFKEIELPIFLTEVFEQEQKSADRRGVKLDLPKPPTGVKMDSDPKLLAEAIHELVQNAVMYSPVGGRVGIELQMEPLEFVLRVRDRGLGISEEQAPLIFTKFFRGQNIPSDAAGAGLGLFIAREYCRLMGGKLWFESQLGKGSTFTISLPRLRGMQS